jgi:20S proteasome subunit alpha 6
LATLKRASSELSSHQKKIFKIDDHMAIAIAGLTADARVLSRYMRQETLNHKYVFERPMPVSRLVCQVADKSQIGTQRSGKRPYGVGLLVIGCDESGPCLFNTTPDGSYNEYKAQAIGAQSQAGRTYLEKTFETYDDATLDDLINHALLALKECASDHEINSRNCSLAIVGIGENLRCLDDEDVQPYIDKLQAAEEGDDAPPAEDA